jgi:hypothetical protein
MTYGYLIAAVFMAMISFEITKRKGWSQFPPWLGAVVGFLFGLIGVIVLACIPSPLAAREKYWEGRLQGNLSSAQRTKADAKLAKVRAQIAAKHPQAVAH